jgi:hypothetical protein
MKEKLSDCQLPRAAMDVKGDHGGGYLFVGSAHTVRDYEGFAGKPRSPSCFHLTWKLQAVS